MRHHAATHLLLRFILIANLAAGPHAGGQQAQIPNPPTGSKSASAMATSAPPDTQGPFLRAVLNTNSDQGDYIPCEFSREQLFGLRPSPITEYLTFYDAEAVKEAVISAAPSDSTTVSINGKDKTFVQAIGDLDLSNRTRSQALAAVMDVYRQYQAKAIDKTVDETVKAAPTVEQPGTSTETAQLLKEYRDALSKVDISNLSPSEAARRLSAAGDEFVVQAQHAVTQAAAQQAADQAAVERTQRARQNAKATADTVHTILDGAKARAARAYKILEDAQKTKAGATEKQRTDAEQADTALRQAQTDAEQADTALQEAQSDYEKATAAAQRHAGGASQNAVSAVAATNSKTQSAVEQASQGATKDAQAVADSARNAGNKLTRPTDVGCAMSILSSRESQFDFGGLASKEYIAVQVVVRNLNPNQQFLIHDAELGVDSDLNGRVGRFFSARDQKIVRALVLGEKSHSLRNVVVGLAGAIGTIASAAMVFAGPSFKDATGVYNGGFLPSLKGWPDYSTDQLNRLNDMGFSASTDSKAILVPKSGAAIFVMFVPSKPFEQGWWTQKCAEEIAVNPSSKSVTDTPEQMREVGIYLKDAQAQCQPPKRDPSRPFKRVHYGDWSPTADEIFRELAFTVVSGTHIAEQSNTSPTVSDLQCPKDKLGNVDFTKQSNGSIACTAKGTNFDKVVKMILRDAGDATDNTTADGSVTISGDASTAKVDFPLAQIGPLEKPDYKVYTVTQAGAEDDSKQVLHFDVKTPFFVDVTPKTTIDLSKLDAKATIELTGYHLDKIGKDDKIQLTAGSECSSASTSTAVASNGGNWTQEFSLGATAPLKASFSVVPGKTKVTETGKLNICYDASGKQAQDLKLSVVVSGTYPDVPPAKAEKPVEKKPQQAKPAVGTPAQRKQSPTGTPGNSRSQ